MIGKGDCIMFNFEEELKKLPSKPGVYLMHGETDEIIYVGKAKSLTSRVHQYFQSSRNVSPKIESMISHITRFEYIVTDSEVEALVLECNLIKEHSPKYNTMLKDDKGYPYIKATIKEPFPRLIFVHKRSKDDAKYFGPYVSAGSMKESLDYLRKTYLLRNCSKQIDENTKHARPCLYYQIGQCSAPCIGNITVSEYRDNFEKALDILNGNITSVIKELTAKMTEASDVLDFETAAFYRDRINMVKKIAQKQKTADTAYEDRDIIAMAADGDDAVVQVFFIRQGKMIGREHNYLTGVSGDSEEDVITAFIKQYYQDTPYVPRELVIPCELEECTVIESWLAEKYGHKVTLRAPKKGAKMRLIELAGNNAALVLAKDRERIKREYERTTGAMNDLASLIGLESLDRVESYDISNTSGVESVGSMVVFEDGKPNKHAYRKFKIKTVKGPDDYASMREVLTRRFKRAMEEDDKFTILPDLILMDGGKGQVNIALEVLDSFGLDIPVCGMVKDDTHSTRGLYYNNEEILMKKSSECFRLITRIQDETHRFAIEYHRSLRSKEQVHSILDDIEGIGPARRKALLRAFGSVEVIRTKSVEELLAVDTMNLKSAEKVYEFFNSK